MYSVVVGDVLFVSQELETSNGVLCMDTPWSTHPDDLFDVSIPVPLCGTGNSSTRLCSTYATLRTLQGSTASKLSPILSLLSQCSVPRVGIGLGVQIPVLTTETLVVLIVRCCSDVCCPSGLCLLQRYYTWDYCITLRVCCSSPRACCVSVSNDPGRSS